MRVRLTRPAITDIAEAVEYYDAAEGLGSAFLDQFEITLERLQTFPQGAPPVEGVPGVRRLRLRRFPYGVFYRPGDDELVILRVLHARRDTSRQLAQSSQPPSPPRDA